MTIHLSRFRYSCWLQKIRLECIHPDCVWEKWMESGYVTELIAEMEAHLKECPVRRK